MAGRIGVDLGGTNVRVALVNDQGTVLASHSEKTEAEKGPDYIIAKIINMIDRYKKKEPIRGIGIGAPGPLNAKKGLILNPPNLPGWDHIPLVQKLEKHFQTSVVLDNDANVAALAEAKVGSGQGYESVFYLTVSTGIGGGFVINDRIYSGAHGYAAEIGNMIIDPSGYKHANMNQGSWESLASGTAIARQALKEFGHTGGTKEVFTLAQEGHESAVKIVHQTVDYLAMGIANIAHTIDPDVFVLGGGVMNSKTLILEPLKQKVKEYVYPELAESIHIVHASLEDQAGVVGAALLI
ncbi:ROK family protein [Bacillus horti]|uniref:Glucokinase n=1 Tax=Caldalkalibacillus horti TaxID=77523 RepID=A0ABT9VXY4_9BACI|nr:ROK family protein [Bacillus horti]MDQ0165846.1 glucokinase [Bacillus horti]